jgi:hypothetical protein
VSKTRRMRRVGHVAREERCIQGFGRETWYKITTCKTLL